MAYDVRFLKGTLATFEAQKTANTLDKNTFYYVDETDLYLGDILLSNDEDVKAAVARIKVNEDDIADIKAELDALVDPDGSGAGSITSQITALRTELTNKINDNKDLILAEVERAKKAEGELQTNLTNVTDDLSELTSTVEEQEISIGTLSSNVTNLTTTVQENTKGITDIRNDLREIYPTISSLETASATHTSQLTTLIGDDTGKSVREIALHELSHQLIPENAQEALNTLEEIAAWLQQHPKDAAEMNQKIGANTQSINDLKEITTDHAGRVQSLEEIVANINNTSTGILALAKHYTDSEIDKIELTLDELIDNVNDNADAIAAINHSTTGILATANANIQTAINNLGLGSAAYKNVSDFDAAGSAAAALNEAKAYTDVALTWGEIKVN